MPKLEQVDVSPQEAHSYLNTGPMTQGAEGLERAGRMVTEYGRIQQEELTKAGQYAREVQNEYNKHATFAEISNQSAAWSNLQNQKSEEWNQGLKDGSAEDPKWAQQFNQKWSIQEQNWSGAFTTDAGKEFALRRMEASENHWSEKQMADKSTLDSYRTAQNFKSQLILSSKRAYDDPTAAPQAIDDIQASLKAQIMSSNMTGAHAAEFQAKADTEINKIALAAGYSMADKNPEAWLGRQGIPKEVGDRISGEQYNTLDNRAREAMRQNAAQGRLANAEQKRQVQEGFDSAIAQSQADNVTYSQRPDGRVGMNISPNAWTDVKRLQDQAAASKGLIDNAHLRSYYNFLKSGQNDPDNFNPTVYSDLTGQLLGGTLTLDKVRDARSAGQITVEDFRHFSEKLADPARMTPALRSLDGSTKAAFKAASGFIMPSAAVMGIPLPQEAERNYEFQHDVQMKIDAAHASGMSPAQINATFFTPGNKEYILAPANIARFQLGSKAGLEYTTQNLRTGTPVPAAPVAGVPSSMKREPNESLSDYDKRTGYK